MPVLASERLDPVDPIDTPAGAVGTADLAALDVYVRRARMSKHRRSEHARVTGTPRHCRDPQWLGDGEVVSTSSPLLVATAPSGPTTSRTSTPGPSTCART